MTAELRKAIAQLRGREILFEAIARLRSVDWRRQNSRALVSDVMLVCDALEGYVNAAKPKFDRRAYMREYMRNYRRNMSAAKRANAQYIKAFPEEKD